MNNIKEILDSLWLENNESIVYLEAIKLWTVPASSIANKLNLPRTTIRYACESLVKKWLLISITKWNTKLFTAEHPNKIKNLLQVEKNKLEEKENKLNKVMSDMLQMYNPYTKLPKVTFYEWEEGIKKVLEDTLTSTEIIDSFKELASSTENNNLFGTSTVFNSTTTHEQEKQEALTTELAAQEEHLDAQAAELSDTKSTLRSMQAQLAEGQKEVAVQREQLLDRLGGAPPLPTEIRQGRIESEESTPVDSSVESVPKPASSQAAAQFRKLRRDAKRKVVGL